MAESNKSIGEFTPEMIARHNSIPEGNKRKGIGQDRGKYINYEPPVFGQGEFDKPVNAKNSGNE